MRSKRIELLEFVNHFAVGGTERQFVNLAERLDPETFALHLACLRRWGHFLDRAEKLGAPIGEYSLSRLFGLDALRQRIRLGRYLRRHGVQVVHTYNFYPNVFAIPAARAAGVPVVIASIRDMGAFLTPLKKRVHRLVCGLADCIVVNAEAIRSWLVAEGYEPRKIVVIPNGIEVSPFSGAGGSGKLQRELGLPSETPLVAVLSHVIPEKGLEDFLEAAAGVAGRFPEARFLFVGGRFRVKDGEIVPHPGYGEELGRRARQLGLDGRVVFTGYRMDVPEILPDIAVSVLPSLMEGLSNTLLESMAAGRPVVATRVGGSPEAVEDGTTGLLVPPRDPAALSRAICRLLERPDLADRLGRAARRSVIERFSVERMVRDTERLYLDMLAEKASTRTFAIRNSPGQCGFLRERQLERRESEDSSARRRGEDHAISKQSERFAG